MAGAVATISKIAYSSNYEENDNTDATGSAGAVGHISFFFHFIYFHKTANKYTIFSFCLQSGISMILNSTFEYCIII